MLLDLLTLSPDQCLVPLAKDNGTKAAVDMFVMMMQHPRRELISYQVKVVDNI